MMIEQPGPVLLLAEAAIWSDGKVLVVNEREDSGPGRWGLPGGQVRPGELLLDALVREVAEETGLRATEVGSLAFVTQHRTHEFPGSALVLTFEVPAYQGEIAPRDPDGDIIAAEFVDPSVAIDRMHGFGDGPQSVPLESYLSSRRDGKAAEQCWFWNRDTEGPYSMRVTPAVLGEHLGNAVSSERMVADA